MRQRHALGLTGAAGGVLQQRQIVCRRARICKGRAALASNSSADSTVRKLGRCAFNSGARPRRLGHGDQQAGLGIVEYADLAAQVFFELAEALRRVQRRRHAARQPDTVEAEKELQRGRQHQRHALSGFQSLLPQPRGDTLRAFAERGIAQCVDALIFAVQKKCRALWLLPRLKVQYLDKALRR